MLTPPLVLLGTEHPLMKHTKPLKTLGIEGNFLKQITRPHSKHQP